MLPSREVMLETIQQLPQQKWWPDAMQLLVRGVLAIFVAYVLATSLMTVFALGPLVSFTTGLVARPKATAGSSPSLGIASVNYRDIKKAILERNLFNSEGQYPKEELERAAASADGRPVFDINAPCQPCALNIELVGTIYLGNREKSLATVKEKGLSDADVYRVGDVIIGSDDAVIAAVERNELIINNKGIKECLSLKSDIEKQIESGEGGSGQASVTGAPEQLPPVLVDGPYVESELGAGFGKIINAARFVPNLTDSQMNGFKIFAIDPSSLFSKVGLQNGDIITQVNDVSLKNPDQGFALYEAFRNEREVRISVLRNGSTPQMITVRIK